MSDKTEYTTYVVLRRDPRRPAMGGGIERAVKEVEASGVTIRGFYDVSGMRDDADLMIWMHGPDPQALQQAVRTLRRADLLAALLPSWIAMGVHVQAEFSRSHAPAFMLGKEPKGWLCVYPFVRSYEWYLLPEDERRGMLAEHGRQGSAFTGVLANTVAAFALNDYEWLLGLESDELMDLVDMMRDLRSTEARRHVREEVPFYTGRRIGVDEIEEVIR
ncbi:hydrogen peroxide-dependent heme synthase [Microcella daejeonensis]|uniref:hydrogen peroxide-dependent heme synthase n=1 Tax=Microcella daejeonensis TaxID=2994971 RepID=UPI002D1E3637|nr:hydrogen peroxide-dependent heme synthase [Microcella daejeonensis]